MPAEGNSTAVGVFADRSHARLAIDDLMNNGFTLDQIGLVIPEGEPVIEPPALDAGSKAGEGAATGAAAGGALGGLVGMALASSVIPGVGPVIAGGMLLAGLTGAITGAAGGTLVGALIGLRIPEEEAHHYQRHLHSGRTLVTVQAGERYPEAVAILKRAAEEAVGPTRTHPESRVARLGGDSTPGPGSGSVFPGG